jgi:hypothetical protein
MPQAAHSLNSVREADGIQIRIPHHKTESDGLAGKSSQIASIPPLNCPIYLVTVGRMAICQCKPIKCLTFGVLHLHTDASSSGGGEIDQKLASPKDDGLCD